MINFKTDSRYSGKIGNVIAVLLPSLEPCHHYVRLISWDGDICHAENIPNPIFSDYIPTFLQQKGFNVDQAEWLEYKDLHA